MKKQFTMQDKIQVAAFGLHFKIYKLSMDNTCAFGMALAATSDFVWGRISPEKKKLAEQCVRQMYKKKTYLKEEL